MKYMVALWLLMFGLAWLAPRKWHHKNKVSPPVVTISVPAWEPTCEHKDGEGYWFIEGSTVNYSAKSCYDALAKWFNSTPPKRLPIA